MKLASLVLSAGLTLGLFAAAAPAEARDHGGWHGHDGWRGGVSVNHWRGGYWHHGWYSHRLGWWWVVPSAGWYYYNDPIYPYPDYYRPSTVIIQQDSPPPVTGAPPAATWYYCDNPKGYYPYVSECRKEWRPVPATPPGQ